MNPEAAPPVRIGVVPPANPPPEGVRRLQVLLIKPSKYDDDGYVMRYIRGVLPSNTLAVLAGLTRQAADEGSLGAVRVDVRMLDEHVQRIDPAKLARKYLRPGIRPLVALCGVQTNQFPRAADLALEFHAAGMPVMLGGFHVSGSIAMSPTGMPSECQALIDQGVTLVKGEVEECWSDLLRDALHDELKPFYDIPRGPDLACADLPLVDPKLMKKFAYPRMGTIDAGRGCPFSCSFCTIINVQGRKMRTRNVGQIKDCIRRNWDRKIDYYFFTDDNFSRNPHWQEIFKALIELREEDGIAIGFMMQVDVLAYRVKDFMSMAAEAGCTQVFIGMETINQDNIAAAGKRQNRVGDYRRMIRAWQENGIACHVAYIIGFPFDSVDSVRRDVRRLRDEIGADQASFFMLTPLPGSQDHADMVRRGEWMDEDYNRFDSFHPTTRHPLMNAAEWFGAYKQAWCDFYSLDGMKTILARANPLTYWGLFKNFVWYRHSALVENTHPMICGFVRLKDRKQRRPGYAVEGVWRHYHRRVRDLAQWARKVVTFYFEMQEVWLATHGQIKLWDNVDELRRRYAEMCGRLGDRASQAGEALSQQASGMRGGAGEMWQRAGDAISQKAAGVRGGAEEMWQRAGETISQKAAGVRGGAEEMWQRAGEVRRQTAEDMAARLNKLREQEPRSAGPWRRLGSRLNPLRIRVESRRHLNEYWQQTYMKLRRGRIFRINPMMLGINFVRDARLCLLFNLAFLLSHGK